MPSYIPVLLSRQDLRPQADQRTGLCLLQERLWQRYISCHYLIIDQAVILCYELSDQEVLTLHQIKAHDVGAFTAKAFQSGVSTVIISLSLEIPQHNCTWRM